jgi:integrase/recombinase XerD
MLLAELISARIGAPGAPGAPSLSKGDTSLMSPFARMLAAEGKPVTTQRLYLWAARQLAQALGPEAAVCAVTSVAVRTVYSAYRDTHRPRSTCALRSGLRAFARYLLAEGLVAADPTEGLQAPRLDEARRDVVTRSQFEDLLEATARLRSDHRAALAKCAIAILGYAALRRTEMLDLELRDVNLEERTLTVRHGKGDVYRTVTVCKSCIDAIRAYLRVRPKCVSKALLLRTAQTTLGKAALYGLIQEVAAIAGYKGDPVIHPHAFRHFYVTDQLSRGANPTIVSRTVGHKSVGFTLTVYNNPDQAAYRAVADMMDTAPARPRGAAGGKAGYIEARRRRISMRREG